MNGKKWKATKKKVNEEIRKKIKELLQIYVLRENQQGIQLFGDKELEDKFRESFPYIETPDQERSIREILEDLESPKPMDRLLAGDSGSETEVAMRAAFRTVVSNYQYCCWLQLSYLPLNIMRALKREWNLLVSK